MEFKSGKHAGKTTEEVLMKQPDFARWYVRNHPDSPHAKAFGQCAKAFGEKPFTEKCQGKCGNRATRATAYRGTHGLMFWCNDCNPVSSGAEGQKLSVVRTIRDVLDHIELTANGNRDYMRRIVRELAEGKGLKSPISKKKLETFFSK